jgi:hypothetical protein
MSFAWLARAADGKVTVASGQHAEQAWPDDTPDWPAGRIGPVQCPIISPQLQIDSKEMWATWVPDSPRRDKDDADVARLRQALRSLQP